LWSGCFGQWRLGRRRGWHDRQIAFRNPTYQRTPRRFAVSRTPCRHRLSLDRKTVESLPALRWQVERTHRPFSRRHASPFAFDQMFLGFQLVVDHHHFAASNAGFVQTFEVQTVPDGS